MWNTKGKEEKERGKDHLRLDAHTVHVREPALDVGQLTPALRRVVDVVAFFDTKHLDELLQAAGADAELHLVAGAGHGFSSPSGAWPDAEQAMFGFLEDRGISE